MLHNLCRVGKLWEIKETKGSWGNFRELVQLLDNTQYPTTSQQIPCTLAQEAGQQDVALKIPLEPTHDAVRIDLLVVNLLPHVVLLKYSQLLTGFVSEMGLLRTEAEACCQARINFASHVTLDTGPTFIGACGRAKTQLKDSNLEPSPSRGVALPLS